MNVGRIINAGKSLDVITPANKNVLKYGKKEAYNATVDLLDSAKLRGEAKVILNEVPEHQRHWFERAVAEQNKTELKPLVQNMTIELKKGPAFIRKALDNLEQMFPNSKKLSSDVRAQKVNVSLIDGEGFPHKAQTVVNKVKNGLGIE